MREMAARDWQGSKETKQGLFPAATRNAPSPAEKDRADRVKGRVIGATLLLLVVLLLCFSRRSSHENLQRVLRQLDHSQQTSLYDFGDLKKHCAAVQPISAAEFRTRQDALAKLLRSHNASAYIAEPGANAQYFANISSSQWHPSERPLLLIVAPESNDSLKFVTANGGNVKLRARTIVLTPTFEATRARQLPIAADDVSFVEWPEEANPYDVALSALGVSDSSTIFVDDAARLFIANGLARTVPKPTVLAAPSTIAQLRERKSPAEIKIMKCANEVTVLAIRVARSKMRVGIHESEARRLIVSALSAAGLSGANAITLFGENAALPHGGGTDRILGKGDLVLVDCGGSLHGYSSDITRTFGLPESRIPSEHLRIWFSVLEAQNAAIKVAHAGNVTGAVDKAARLLLEDRGYGQYFTHRLGHGIGLEGHESPYLRGGSEDELLSGHSFSDEPGVYMEGKVGIRLEDTFYISEDGSPVFFTEGVGGQARSPWRL